jgi:carbamoyltransferase
MNVLGLSAFYHDSAAALVCDGEIVAAAQEERFSRRKHDPRFPGHAVEYCLAVKGLALDDLDFIAFYDKPFIKFERLLETYLAFAPRGYRSFAMALPLWIKEKLFQRVFTRTEEARRYCRIDDRLLFAEHHEAHAASAFFPSPFDAAVVLTMDGVGEWATTSVSLGSGKDLQMVRELHFPHSLGLLYSAFTYYTGFKVNSGEYKVMGLAPYGTPKYTSIVFDRLIDLKPDGTFRLDQQYFDYCTGLRMTNEHSTRWPSPQKTGGQLDQFHMDVAALIQAVTDEIMSVSRGTVKEFGSPNPARLEASP